MKYPSFSDAELTDLLRTGDLPAFTEIYNRYSVLLYAHAHNKLRNEAEARDVVQEVFIRLWAKHEDFDIQINLAGYLYGSVRNTIFNLIKHKKIVTAYAIAFTEPSQNQSASTDHLIREKQLAAIIETEIAALPPRMREVFELRRKEHLSNKEIALRMGITESTVADQMKKALRTLRLRIGMVIIIAAMFHY